MPMRIVLLTAAGTVLVAGWRPGVHTARPAAPAARPAAVVHAASPTITPVAHPRTSAPPVIADVAGNASGMGDADLADMTMPDSLADAVEDEARQNGCHVFDVELRSARGGQPSPGAAAAWYAENTRSEHLPSTGWHAYSDEAGRGSSQVWVSGQDVVRVVEGPDNTWQVESGASC